VQDVHDPFVARRTDGPRQGEQTTAAPGVGERYGVTGVRCLIAAGSAVLGQVAAVGPIGVVPAVAGDGIRKGTAVAGAGCPLALHVLALPAPVDP
jgi:hypothetical protein